MGSVSCSMCKTEVQMVDGPTMCTSCGFTILPEGHPASEAPPAAAEPAAQEPAVPLELSAWRGLAKHQAAADGTPSVAEAVAEPVAATVEPVEEPAPRPVARSVTQRLAKPSMQPLADSIEALPAAPPAPRPAAKRSAPPEPATEVEAPAPESRPTPPPEAQVRTIVGQSVHKTTSPWEGFHHLGRDGLKCAAAGAIYLLVALTFLAIVCRPFSPKAWALTTFVVMQGFSALVFAGTRWLNRHGRHDDVEQMIFWLATPLLPCLGFNAGILSIHSVVIGAVCTALVVVNGVLLHHRIAAPLPAGPARALQYVAPGMLAAAGLVPLLGAFPPLAACVVAALLWRGQVLITKRAPDQSPQPYLVLKVSLLLLAGALAATVALTRGAWHHGASSLTVWGLFLTSLVLIFRDYCRNDPHALPDEYKPLLDPAVGAGLLAGFAATLGDPVGMVVTGGIAGAALVRESLRRARALLILPALAISLGIYAWLPDPRALGMQSLRVVLPPAIEKLTGASHLTSLAIYFAPWAIALAVAWALLIRRGHAAHARVVGACALPATVAACAGMVLGATQHWLLGASLAATSGALIVCGLLARQAVAVLPGALGLLCGVGAAAFALQLPYPLIELALTLTMLGVLLALGAATPYSSDFVRGVARRWVDASTLFVLTAIPVAASAYHFAFPSDLTTIGNEAAIGLLAFFVAHAWRRPEAAVVAAALFGRACTGLLALRFPNLTPVQAVQVFGGVSALPVVLWCLAPLFPLDRRIVPPAPPGAMAALLSVWAIQAFAGWKYWRNLIGIEKEIPTLVTTAGFVLVPWIAAIVVGLCVGHGRRRAARPVAS
jgi:hypothetical protein